MLMSKRELKFIVVLRNSNHIYVFRKDEVLIQNSSDFIEAIGQLRHININSEEDVCMSDENLQFVIPGNFYTIIQSDYHQGGQA